MTWVFAKCDPRISQEVFLQTFVSGSKFSMPRRKKWDERHIYLHENHKFKPFMEVNIPYIECLGWWEGNFTTFGSARVVQCIWVIRGNLIDRLGYSTKTALASPRVPYFAEFFHGWKKTLTNHNHFEQNFVAGSI